MTHYPNAAEFNYDFQLSRTSIFPCREKFKYWPKGLARICPSQVLVKLCEVAHSYEKVNLLGLGSTLLLLHFIHTKELA